MCVCFFFPSPFDCQVRVSNVSPLPTTEIVPFCVLFGGLYAIRALVVLGGISIAEAQLKQ